jgi:hypothetical protein
MGNDEIQINTNGHYNIKNLSNIEPHPQKSIIFSSRLWISYWKKIFWRLTLGNVTIQLSNGLSYYNTRSLNF